MRRALERFHSDAATRVGALICGWLTMAAAVAAAAPPEPDHVVVVVEENHAYSQIIGSPSAPYMNALAAAGASLTNCYAITHPSQPNYLQFFSGSNQGVTDNSLPAGLPFSTLNLGAALVAAGSSFGGYSEDLPAVGSNVEISGAYHRKHNPWVNWQAGSPGPNQLPPSVNMPFTSFPADYSTLPAVSIVVPNQLNDMHDGTIAQADAWLQTNIGPYATWAQTHNSLLVLTWDEDNSASRNRIATILYGPMVTPGGNDSVWTLHNLLRTVEDMYGVAHSGSAASVRPITGVFSTDTPTATRTFQHGVAGYLDCHDTWIEQANPNTAHGGETINVVDGSPLSQGLVRFDNVVGSAASQIPPQATILSAKLMLLTGSTSGDTSVNATSAHRMKSDWSQTSTWNSLVGGVSADDVEAAAAAEFTLIPNVLTAWAIFDVTDSVQAFANGSATNYGWLVNPGGTDGWRWVSAEGAAAGDRPRLSVTIDLASCRPVVSQSPGDVILRAGQPALLSVLASATTPLSYQWRKNNENLADGGAVSGSATATLSINPIAVDDAGAYDVIVTDVCGSVSSSPGQVSVCPGPATGDMNGDGKTDGNDVQPFCDAAIAGATTFAQVCPGDFDGDRTVDLPDVPFFAEALVAP